MRKRIEEKAYVAETGKHRFCQLLPASTTRKNSGRVWVRSGCHHARGIQMYIYVLVGLVRYWA